jgi:hypothetical protein
MEKTASSRVPTRSAMRSPSSRQDIAARQAIEELYLKRALQTVDAPRDRRMVCAKPAGGRREIALAHKLGKETKVIPIHLRIFAQKLRRDKEFLRSDTVPRLVLSQGDQQ